MNSCWLCALQALRVKVKDRQAYFIVIIFKSFTTHYCPIHEGIILILGISIPFTLTHERPAEFLSLL